jgi:hypothetical protein
MNLLLKKNYSDASIPGSLSGLQNFSRSLKKQGEKVGLAKIRDYLISEPAYSLHKPARRKYKRSKVTSLGIDYLWQIDLVDMLKYSSINKGYKYLLTCIDVFSKYAWIKPIKSKEGDSVLKAFMEIMSEGRRPVKIQSDEGKEFLNKPFRDFLLKNDITLYIVNSELKASVVERFNRTLKEKMWRYFTFKGKYVYHDVLDKLVGSYNKSYHRIIKMRPVDVTKDNEQDIYDSVFSNLGVSLNKFKLNINDKVRISKYKTVFSKGYTPNWSEEIFLVSELLARSVNAYKIRDLSDEPVEGIFYESELQKILKKDDVFKVERIIRSRIKNKIKEVFVKWLGYPEKFNSWEPASSIIK